MRYPLTPFSEEDLLKLAKLCRIECQEEERPALLLQIADVLGYVKQLDQIDTQGVEPCDRVLKTLSNVMREDAIGKVLPREEFLSNAPSHTGGMIRVPPVIKSSNPP